MNDFAVVVDGNVFFESVPQHDAVSPFGEADNQDAVYDGQSQPQNLLQHGLVLMWYCHYPLKRRDVIAEGQREIDRTFIVSGRQVLPSIVNCLCPTSYTYSSQ